MANNIYSIRDSYISWNEDFTRVRLADRYDDIIMATSTLTTLVERLSLQEDTTGCGVVFDISFKNDITYQKYLEGILLQKDKAAIFFSYKTFEKLIANFSQAQAKVSCELTENGWLVDNGPVVFSFWQMEALYANMRAADNLDMSFSNTHIEFYQDKILITWQGIEPIEYDIEKFAAMLDNWKAQVKENEE